MLIEYMNYSLSKTPTTIMTEDVFGDTGLSFSLSAKYSAVVSFLKSQFNALLKDSYSIEVERITNSTSEDDNDIFKSVWKTEYFLKDKFQDLFKAARRRNNKKRNNNGNNGGFIAGRPMSR